MADLKTILDQMNDYMNTNQEYSVTTRQKYVSIIRLFLLEKGFTFNINDINEFISKRNSKNNCYIYKFAFKTFLASIGKAKWYFDLKSVKRKPRKKVFNHIDKGTIQQMINLMPSKYRYMAMIQLKTGCRFIEVATIRAENIDFEMHDQLIYIKLGIGLSKTKGDKTRLVRLHKKYEPLFRKLMIKPFGYLFLAPIFETYTKEEIYTKLETVKRTYNRELTIVGQKFGFENFSSHYLRHLFADEFMLSGGSIESLKIIMGHAKLDTTMDYVSIGDKFADIVIEQMG